MNKFTCSINTNVFQH